MNPYILKNKKNDKKTIVYPNPTKDILNIDFANPNGNEYIFNLFDENGKSLFILNNIKTDKIFLNTSDLKDGVYFYSLDNNGKSETGKVVINKH